MSESSEPARTPASAPPPGPRPPHGGARRAGLGRKLALSRLALVWERLWAVLWPAASLILFTLAVALSDLLPLLPGWLHAAILGILGLSVLAALFDGLRRLRLPTAQDARHRLEADARHRPLTASTDRPGTPRDSVGDVLWRAHLRRMADATAALRPRWPHPGVPARDPHALRFIPVLAFALAVVVAWDDPRARLTRALTPPLPSMLGTGATVELWITPPPYTGLAPVYRQAPATDTPADTASQRLVVPEGSTLLVLIQGASDADVEVGDTPYTPESLGDQSLRLETALRPTAPGARLTVSTGFLSIAEWPLAVVPDEAPSVAFTGPPTEGPRWTLRVPVRADDDFGLHGLALTLSRPGAPSHEAAEVIDLPLPSRPPRTIDTESLVDLTAHPWAGLEVTGRLVARDGRDQASESEPSTFLLPERDFQHPVARAIIAQRKALAGNPNRRFAVAPDLDRLSSRPETFGGDTVVFLALRVAATRLRYGVGRAAVESVIDMLWQTALRVEDGRLATAERRLNDAQDALKEALRSGADAADIRRLAEDLRAAIAEYLRELAARMPELEGLDLALDGSALDASMLDNMLQQLSDLSELGARDAAEALMRRLDRMLQGLREARPTSAEALQQVQEVMRRLNAIAKEQEDLLQKSFEQVHIPGQSRDRPAPQAGARPERAALAEAQDSLRRRLGEVMETLAEQTTRVPDSLGAAELHMRDAVAALAEGAWGQAQEAQGAALEALRSGRQQAARQMLQSLGQGMLALPRGFDSSHDPLGRNPGAVSVDGVKVPTEPDQRRAFEILKELRRRANDSFRPPEERDYLRRLMEQF